MKVHYVTFGVIFVSMLILSTTTWLQSLSDHNSVNVDLTGINNTMSRLNEQQDKVDSIRTTIQDMQLTTVEEAFEIPYEMIKTGWKATELFFGSFTVVGDILNDIITGLGDNGIPLPGWLLSSVISLIVLVLGAILSYALFKWKFED